MGRSDEVDEETLVGIPPLDEPRFVSRIPANLLESCNPRDREILTTLNIMAQQQDWATQVLIQHHKLIQAHEKRQVRVERWRTVLVNRWSPFVYLGLAAIPFIIAKIVERISQTAH